MNRKELKNILEVLFFITDRPISVKELKDIITKGSSENSAEAVNITEELIVQLINELKQEYSNKPIELREIAGGWQFATKSEYSIYVKKLFQDRTTLRLSTSALETLSIIAYKQPVTRAEIEEIRGVEVISVLETLLERKLIKIVGRKETVGRPLLYGTTPEFLRYFGLKSIDALPPIEEFVQEQKSELEVETNPRLDGYEVERQNYQEGNRNART
ncbi:MAG: SMC-Scp complex subunit ScpB [Elusimicrobiota bacterium]|nr:SMC-Scp complex subunit ScpB [Elusimicrobiota bacterium]